MVAGVVEVEDHRMAAATISVTAAVIGDGSDTTQTCKTDTPFACIFVRRFLHS